MVPGFLHEELLFDHSLALVSLGELQVTFLSNYDAQWIFPDLHWGDVIPSTFFAPPWRSKQILGLWQGWHSQWCDTSLTQRTGRHSNDHLESNWESSCLISPLNPSASVYQWCFFLQRSCGSGKKLKWGIDMWRGKRGGKAQKVGQKASAVPFPPLGRNTNISSSPPARSVKTARLNCRGSRVTPTWATDSPTSGWEMAQQRCSN